MHTAAAGEEPPKSGNTLDRAVLLPLAARLVLRSRSVVEKLDFGGVIEGEQCGALSLEWGAVSEPLV